MKIASVTGHINRELDYKERAILTLVIGGSNLLLDYEIIRIISVTWVIYLFVTLFYYIGIKISTYNI